MDQFTRFATEKEGVLKTLDGLDAILVEMTTFGVDARDEREKVRSAKAAIESDVLRIALLGAFSDGKTSVVAAWLGKVEADMKIDIDESSDRLAVYTPEGLPDRCEIVDTPGLFGDKTRVIDGQTVMYEDLTKRYISEAHLIFYVVDATNPLKDSHRDIVAWMLRDLNKLASTLFVINKMDEVCDLKDSASFSDQSEIKSTNLIGKLTRAASLTEEEVSELQIVCVSADPNGRGLPFWFGKMAEYEARSRIPVMKQRTAEILSRSVRETLRAKTGLDVVQDVAHQKLQALEAEYAVLAQGHGKTQQEITRIQQDIATGRRAVSAHARNLTSDLDALEKELMAKLRPLEMRDMCAFLEDEIGLLGEKVGHKFQRRIVHIVDEYTQQSFDVVSRIGEDIVTQLDDGNRFFEALGKRATSLASLGLQNLTMLDPATIRHAIFKMRDILSGLGLGIPFKPWDASKLAGGVTKWAGPIGIVLQVGTDIYQMTKQAERENLLKRTKEEIGTAIMATTESVRELLHPDEKMFAFLSPQLQEFEQILQMLTRELAKFEAGKHAIDGFHERLDVLRRCAERIRY